MTIIAPSILSADFLELGEEVKSLGSGNNLWMHLDIMDGHFVPNLTFGQTVVKNLSRVTNHPLDAHFMVTNPEDYLEAFKDVGLHNFTFHWEATQHHDSLIQRLKAIYPSVGISLNPSTPVSVIPDYLFEQIDLVLIMSVNPGFGGQKFISGVIEKIKTLHHLKTKLKTDFEIQVDGGVSDQNAKELVAAGATNLVAGSYIFKGEKSSYPNQIESLRS